jgi:hypothetical protein
MSTINSKNSTSHLEREKLKELKEGRGAIKKGKRLPLPFFFVE